MSAAVVLFVSGFALGLFLVWMSDRIPAVEIQFKTKAKP